MNALLSKQIDVAEAMTYNEYAQVLEAEEPNDRQLNQPGDFNLIDWNTEGTAMLQDAVFARKAWLARARQRGRRRQVPPSDVQGLDLLPRQRREVRRLHRSPQARRSARATRPGR